MARVVCVTGGCGFIGRHVVETLLHRGDFVYVVDALTAAADPQLPQWWAQNYGTRIRFVSADINALERLPAVDAVVNLAAETHVDNSIAAPERFLRSNVLGVAHLLDLCRGATQFGVPRFLQISTDEVYGDGAELDAAAPETARLQPSSPYAATKAAADQLVMAWGRTYSVPWNIVRPSNCYGPGQYPEKFVPRMARAIRLGRPIELHDGGHQRRSWLHVEDCTAAILTVLDKAEPYTVYNIAGEVYSIADMARLGAPDHPRRFVPSPRPGADQWYCVDDTHLRVLGWRPTRTVADTLPGIVDKMVAGGFRW